MRPPSTTTSNPDGAFGLRRASIATTTHCAPKRRDAARTISGSRTAAEFTLTLSQPGAQEIVDVLDAGDAAADRERDGELGGDRAHDGERRAAPFDGRGDVEEHELVGAFGFVAARELDGIAGVAQLDETHALDDAAFFDVQTGNDPASQHDRPSFAARPASSSPARRLRTRCGRPSC